MKAALVLSVLCLAAATSARADDSSTIRIPMRAWKLSNCLSPSAKMSLVAHGRIARLTSEEITQQLVDADRFCADAKAEADKMAP